MLKHFNVIGVIYESVIEENNWLICYLCPKIQYFHAGFLPYFLAPVKKQHHTTTTEQQNFDTPAQQPSEEEYFYPTIIKHISFGFCGFLIQQHEDTYMYVADSIKVPLEIGNWALSIWAYGTM